MYKFTAVFVIVLTVINLGFGIVPSSPNVLYNGEKLSEFFEFCTIRSTIPCVLSSAEDFLRLQEVKIYIKEQVEFYVSPVRLILALSCLGVIIVLMIHLVITRHFDWRMLPLINLKFDIDNIDDKTNGVKYHQYVWMKYLVLRGNHPIFRNRAFGEIKWYKYKPRDKEFDYKSVVIKQFTFLDKKALTKHLAEAEDDEKQEGQLDKQGTDMEFHPTVH